MVGNDDRKPLFILPNGSSLKYNIIQKGIRTGNQHKWWVKLDSEYFWKRSRMNKESLPMLGLWNSKSNQHLICADFDNYPPFLSSFDDLFDMLNSAYGEKGIVVRSFSNNVKVFFLVEKDTLRPPNTTEAIRCLTKIHPMLAAFADRQGLDKSYLNESMAKIIMSRLPTLPVIQRIESIKADGEPKEEPKKNKEPSTTEIVFFDGQLPPALLAFVNSYKNKTVEERERLLRFILGKPDLAIKSIQLPVKHIAKAIGTNQQNVSHWIKLLKAKKWLDVVDKGYKKGIRAKSYQLCGPLKSFCSTLKDSKRLASNYVPPKTIPDGQWNQELFRAMNYFWNDILFLKWFSSVPGNRLKTRRIQAETQVKRWRGSRESSSTIVPSIITPKNSRN